VLRIFHGFVKQSNWLFWTNISRLICGSPARLTHLVFKDHLIWFESCHTICPLIILNQLQGFSLFWSIKFLIQFTVVIEFVCVWLNYRSRILWVTFKVIYSCSIQHFRRFIDMPWYFCIQRFHMVVVIRKFLPLVKRHFASCVIWSLTFHFSGVVYLTILHILVTTFQSWHSILRFLLVSH